MLHLEKMKTTDFPFAVALANSMGWSMTTEDFELSLKIEPEGCLVLFDEQQHAGISTCVSYGKIGWFGDLVVEPVFRRHGGGALLLREAISYLQDKGVETIGLFSYHDLVGFYRNAGFRIESEFSVFQGKTNFPRIQYEPKRITSKDLSAVIKFDREFFLGDRGKLLKTILMNWKNQCYLSRGNGKIEGYAASKSGDTVTEVGPLVCRGGNYELAKSLLEAAIRNSTSREVFVCVPTENGTLVEAIMNLGLRESFRVARMFLGPSPVRDCVYAAESLERG